MDTILLMAIGAILILFFLGVILGTAENGGGKFRANQNPITPKPKVKPRGQGVRGYPPLPVPPTTERFRGNEKGAISKDESEGAKAILRCMRKKQGGGT